MIKLNLPLKKDEVYALHAGDSVSLTGTILTARDCAHKRIFALFDGGEKLPFELKDAVIYYGVPVPPRPTRLREVAVPPLRREWKDLRRGLSTWGWARL